MHVQLTMIYLIRLAAEMNKKISTNETSLENIAIKCRPMNIADDFNNFVSSVWLEAKQVLDGSRMGEEKSVRFLTDTMMVGILKYIFNAYVR